MPISRTKKDSLVESQLSGKVISDIKEESPKPEVKETVAEKKVKVEKKPGFLRTTFEELRKVDWPSFGYVVRWSSVIILFTIFVALFLGFFDHIFTGTVKFIDCTSIEGRNQNVRDCGVEFGEYITFRRS